MKPIVMNVWVDPKTRQASESPVRIEFTDVNSLKRLRDSGLKFEVDGPETPSGQANSYSGKCCYCHDLIRREIELDFFSEDDEIHKFHRVCLELYLLGGAHDTV